MEAVGFTEKGSLLIVRKYVGCWLYEKKKVGYLLYGKKIGFWLHKKGSGEVAQTKAVFPLLKWGLLLK